MSDLTDFLLARIAEDESVARAATTGPWEVRPYWFTSDGRSWAAVPDVINEDIDAKDAEHIARWDPARVLAECEAKRRIVDLYLGASDARSKMTDPIKQLLGDTIVETHQDTLRCLALPYADHPDWREEWRP